MFLLRPGQHDVSFRKLRICGTMREKMDKKNGEKREKVDESDSTEKRPERMRNEGDGRCV